MHIEIDPAIQQAHPRLRLPTLTALVQVGPAPDTLRREMIVLAEQRAAELTIDAISSLDPIAATRDLYRVLGKKPGRYRPSAEALLRRIVSGKGLYEINNVVDIINLVSAGSGYSIGGYDADRIEGAVRLGVGEENEPYDAIARGQLNVGSLPVLRDERGAFGSPTSDTTRTRITEATRRLLLVFFDCGGDDQLPHWLERTAELLRRYAAAEEVRLD